MKKMPRPTFGESKASPSASSVGSEEPSRTLQERIAEPVKDFLKKSPKANHFAKARIELRFFTGSPEDHGRGDPSAVRVVLMPRSAAGWNAGGNAMGAILEENARVPTVYILVPVVERTIGLSVESKERIHDGRKAHALARALARVLVHETVHAIDADIPHGPEGSVMSENLSRELLLGDRLAIHETTADRLRASQRIAVQMRE